MCLNTYLLGANPIHSDLVQYHIKLRFCIVGCVHLSLICSVVDFLIRLIKYILVLGFGLIYFTFQFDSIDPQTPENTSSDPRDGRLSES